MFDLEKEWEKLEKRKPTLVALLYFVIVFVIALILIWFLLFSGISSSADFVYNQF
ncbi:MAG: hypothetical protein ACOYD7_08545 [Raoultibacter sp.]